MIRLLTVATLMGASLGLATPAVSQDFTQDFQGFYAGVHLDMNTFVTNNADLNNQFNSNAPEQSIFGATGGVSFGYNRYFSGGLLLGIELDYTSEMVIEEFIASNTSGTTGTQVNNALESVIAIKGRAGIQSGNALLYVLGGYAMGSGVFETYAVDSGSGVTSCSTSTCASISEDTNGVVIGAGVDWAFRENWIGRFEVQHMTFSDVDAPVLDAGGDPACSSGATPLCSVVYTPSATSARLGIMYKF